MEHNETTQNGNTKRDKQVSFLHTALQLARMYGVAETLHPIPLLSMEEFFSLFKSWATEYETLSGLDLIIFFEGKIKQKEQDRTNQLRR